MKKSLVLNEGYSDSRLFSNTRNGKIIFKNKYYYDLSNCAGSLILGHNSKIYKKALINLAKKNISNYAHPNHYANRLANIVCKKIRNINQIIFCNSGTEAVYKSMRICRAVNKKKLVVSVTGSWHGSVDQFLYSTGKNFQTLKMSDGLNKFEEKKLIFIPYNDQEKSKKILDKYKQKINCIIVEPIQGCLPLDNIISKPNKYYGYVNGYESKSIINKIRKACKKNKKFNINSTLNGGVRKRLYNIVPCLGKRSFFKYNFYKD